jgi:hypothetical protein
MHTVTHTVAYLAENNTGYRWIAPPYEGAEVLAVRLDLKAIGLYRIVLMTEGEIQHTIYLDGDERVTVKDDPFVGL